MKDLLKKLLYGFYYGLVIIISITYYIFFVNTPLPGLWEKIFIVITGVIIAALYFLSTTFKRAQKAQFMLGTLNPVINSFVFTIVAAVSHYFVLLIFFEKNPPVTVGIPYSIFSFTIKKVLIVGLIYNYLFYLTLMFYLNYIKKRL